MKIGNAIMLMLFISGFLTGTALHLVLAGEGFAVGLIFVIESAALVFMGVYTWHISYEEKRKDERE